MAATDPADPTVPPKRPSPEFWAGIGKLAGALAALVFAITTTIEIRNAKAKAEVAEHAATKEIATADETHAEVAARVNALSAENKRIMLELAKTREFAVERHPDEARTSTGATVLEVKAAIRAAPAPLPVERPVPTVERVQAVAAQVQAQKEAAQ